ncbi:MAG: hypothetical protein R2800_03295 [Flavipsychrobacter sp.]
MNKVYIYAVLLFMACACNKTEKKSTVDVNQYKEILTKSLWSLDDINWRIYDDKGNETIQYSKYSISMCTLVDYYKFSDSVIYVPNDAERGVGCDSIPPVSGEYEISTDGKRFKTSFMYKYPDSMFVFDVLELSNTRFHVKTNPKDSVYNRRNEIEFVFVR